jgi:hypothetical protein
MVCSGQFVLEWQTPCHYDLPDLLKSCWLRFFQLAVIAIPY